MRHVTFCSEDTSEWHSNPFVAKENLFVLCFGSCDANPFFCEDSETRQTASRLGCQLWIWWGHAAQFGSSKDKDFNCPVRVPFGATMASKAPKLCRVCMVFAIAVMASDFLFASHTVPKPATLQKTEDKLTQAGFTVFFLGCFRMLSAFFGFTVNSNCRKPFQFFPCQEANRLGLQPQRRLRQFLLDEGPCLLSYHVRGTEFSFLAELDVGERHFEAIAGKTAEEAKKNAAVAALQALQIEKSTMASPAPASSLPPRHLRGRFWMRSMWRCNQNEISWARRGKYSPHRPTKPCETESDQWERKTFCDHRGWHREEIHEGDVYAARAFGKVSQKQKAKGEPGVGLIDMNHRPIIALDSFHLGKMVACTLHLIVFDVSFFLASHVNAFTFQYIYFVRHFRMAFESFCCQGEFVCSLLWILWCKRFLLWGFRDTTNCKQIRVPVVNMMRTCSAIWIKIKIKISIAPVRVPFGATMASKAPKLCRVCMVFAIAVMASDFLFASHTVPKPARLQKMEDKLTQAGFTVFFGMFSDVVGLFWFYSQFKLSEAISVFSVPGSQSSRASTAAKTATVSAWWRPLPPLVSCPWHRIFLPGGAWRWRTSLWGDCREDCRGGKKNAAVAALQALQIEKSTMTSPAPASSLPPRHLRGRFECEACEDAIKMKFLGPEEANIHRIGQRSHAKLKVINEKEKHFVITVAGTEKRFMKATYMLQELLAKFPKSKRPKASLVLDWLTSTAQSLHWICFT